MSSLSLSWLERDKDTDLNLFIEGKQRNGKNDQEAGVLFYHHHHFHLIIFWDVYVPSNREVSFMYSCVYH